MKKYIIITVVIIIITIIGLIYRQSYISITGIKVQKNDVKDVIINTTTDERYMVTDSKIVFELSNEISKMERYKEVEPLNYPPSKSGYAKFLRVVISTKQGNIGGSFWDFGNKIVLESNGYYWITTNDLFDLMDKSLENAKKLN